MILRNDVSGFAVVATRRWPNGSIRLESSNGLSAARIHDFVRTVDSARRRCQTSCEGLLDPLQSVLAAVELTKPDIDAQVRRMPVATALNGHCRRVPNLFGERGLKGRVTQPNGLSAVRLNPVVTRLSYAVDMVVWALPRYLC
ncbi:MAG: hypothetical protein JWR48_2290 [Mycobacterium sp.]|nr:hypothetical protein [Mycobacterium sp.]